MLMLLLHLQHFHLLLWQATLELLLEAQKEQSCEPPLSSQGSWLS
jgi:hypothetical protein